MSASRDPPSIGSGNSVLAWRNSFRLEGRFRVELEMTEAGLSPHSVWGLSILCLG